MAERLLLFLLPFLSFTQPWHYPPLPSFYNEWSAWCIASLISLVSAWKNTKLHSFASRVSVTGGAIATIALITAFQALSGKLIYPASALLVAGTAITCLGVGAAAHQWSISSHREVLVDALLNGFVFAALLNTLAGGLQLGGWGIHGLEMSERAIPGRLDGLLGQANHFGVLNSVALIALWRHWYIRKNNTGIYTALATVLAFGMIGSGSRIAFVGFIVSLVFILTATKGLPLSKRLVTAVFVSAIAVLAFILYKAVSPETSTSTFRTGTVSIRAELISTAIDIFRGHIWLGGGFGNSAWQRIVDTDAPLRLLISTHAHNIFAQLAAEWGIIGLLAGIVVFLTWGQRAIAAYRDGNPTDIVLVGVTGIILLHSQVEYPLWYQHWLMPFIIVLALLKEPSFNLPSTRTTALLKVIGSFLLVGFGVLVALDYRRIEEVTVDLVRQHQEGNNTIAIPKDKVAEISSFSMFQGEADILLVRTFELDPLFLKHKVTTVENATAYLPTPEMISRYSLYFSYIGQDDRVLRLLNRLDPASKPYAEVTEMLKLHAQNHPGVLDYIISRLPAPSKASKIEK